MLVAVVSSKGMPSGIDRVFVRLSHELRLRSRHFELTQHTYTMDLKRQHVWDYVGDNYVHRLIQNKGDGKLVELRGEGVSTYEIVSDRSFSLRSAHRSDCEQNNYDETTSKTDSSQEKIDSMELEVGRLFVDINS